MDISVKHNYNTFRTNREKKCLGDKARSRVVRHYTKRTTWINWMSSKFKTSAL